jgi:hypothetical protein
MIRARARRIEGAFFSNDIRIALTQVSGHTISPAKRSGYTLRWFMFSTATAGTLTTVAPRYTFNTRLAPPPAFANGDVKSPFEGCWQLSEISIVEGSYFIHGDNPRH